MYHIYKYVFISWDNKAVMAYDNLDMLQNFELKPMFSPHTV